MALIVEDGTGKADAESYISVADADSYFANRGNLTWDALDTDVKEQSLRKATDYMVAAYRSKWKGYRKSTAQALCWPRGWVSRSDAYSPLDTSIDGVVYVPDNVVPVEVQRACCELALRSNDEALMPDLERQPVSEKVGPVFVQYSAFDSAYKVYRQIESLLAPYIREGRVMHTVIRS